MPRGQKGLIRREEVSDANAGRNSVSPTQGRLATGSPGRASRVSVVGLEGSVKATPISEALGEIANIAGGVIKEKYLQKQAKEFAAGKMAHAAGETLESIGGQSAAGERGWRSMNLAKDVQTWYDDANREAVTSGEDQDPEEFAAGMAEQFGSILDTHGEDPEARELLSQLGSELLPNLGRTQAMAYAGANRRKTVTSYQDMLLSVGTSAADSGISVPELLDVDHPSLAGLSEGEIRAAQLGAAGAALNQDRPDIYEAISQEGFKGLTAGQRQTLQNSYQGYQERQSNQFDKELLTDLDNIQTASATGQMSLAQALDQVEDLQEKYGKDDRWAISLGTQISGSLRAFTQRKASQAEAQAKADAREAENRGISDLPFEVQAQIQDTLFSAQLGEMSRDEAVTAIGKLASSNGITTEKSGKEIATKVLAADRSRMTQVASDLRKEEEKRRKKQEERNKARSLLNDPVSFATASSSSKELAFGMAQELVANRAGDLVQNGEDQESVDEWAVDENLKQMSRFGFVPAKVAASVTNDLTHVVDGQGQVKQTAVQALEVYRKMVQKEQRPDLAQDLLTTDLSASIADTALDNLSAYSTPEEALERAWQDHKGDPLTAEQKQQRSRDLLVTPQGRGAIRDAANAAVGAMSADDGVLAFLGATLSETFDPTSNALEQWWRVDDANNNPDLGENTKFMRTLTDETSRLLRTSPDLTPNVAAKRAARDLAGRSSMMAGQIITAPRGKSVRQEMGLDSFQEQGVEQDALHEFIGEYGRELWGEEVYGQWQDRAGVDYSPVQAGHMRVEMLDSSAETLVITPIVPDPTLWSQPLDFIGGAITTGLQSLMGDEFAEDPNLIELPSRTIPLSEIGGFYQAYRESLSEE